CVKCFGGKWFRVGLAYDAPSFAQYRSSLRVIMGKVDPKDNGDANMTVWRTKAEGCKSKLYSYMKTTVPGVFKYFSTRHKIIKDVTVVETNYTEYALLFKYKKFNREYSQVSLYAATYSQWDHRKKEPRVQNSPPALPVWRV
uniref:Prostaglandin D2 synthase a n=1 Tax=Astyanax mexicanus TaxID=7994 RepID=A0A8B9GXR6_ASTMX